MRGAILPFHHTSSWQGSWLSWGTPLPFHLHFNAPRRDEVSPVLD